MVAALTAGQVAGGLAHVLAQLEQADDATQRQLEAEGKRKQKVHSHAADLMPAAAWYLKAVLLRTS